MYRERTSSGQTSVITPNQLYRRRFRFCFIGNNFLSILEKRSSFLEKGFKAWLNFTPPKQHMILIFWNMVHGIFHEIFHEIWKSKKRNIPENWQNSKNIDFFGIWNNPGIFRKNGKTAKMSIFLEYGIFRRIINSPVKRYF